MARQPRKQSGTGIYHVMMRGINRQDIFEDEGDYRFFIRMLSQIVYPKDDDGVIRPSLSTFYAYCLMSNHVHLLMREGTETLPASVKRISAAYARYYNKKYQHYGHLFQDRFKSEPVNDSSYFFTLMRYIHQNPVAGGISKDVPSYKWTSWHEYERGIDEGAVCSVQSVLRRMPIDELRGLVFELLPKATQVLDFDNASKVRTDDDVLNYLSKAFGLSNAFDIQLYCKDRRNDILRSAKEMGASIRQLARLTGISEGMIRNV